MRKLSKKISMLMVLAMLVGLFSGVVSASAASAWSFASGKYDVAVNGSINMESKEYADFDLLKDGAAPAGYTVAWASSDEDVVWVNAKTGQLRANKFGKAADGDKAVISATFTNTATKKSATRSFTIVLGAAKADFTVEAADVTIALGEEVKFAPVVKDAAGNVVKFATHKSYNGYFLDGKAIANPWTPEEAGEYTVTVAQFAKKADVADLAKAVRKDEVKVTVTVDADFDAKATKVKEITVYGAFAADAKFTVKKGAQNVAFTATVAEDGKSAKLALNNKLTNGTYTVAYGDAKVDIVAEDEKATEIVVAEHGGQILTNSTKDVAYVHYDVFNQYGESVRRVFDPSWTVAGADSVTPDRSSGIIELTKATKFDYNDMIVLTGVVTGYGFAESVTATMNIGLQQSVDTVEVLGIVEGDSTELIDGIPASYVGGPYYLVFGLRDNSGRVMEFSDTQAESDLKFISMDPQLATFADPTDVVDVVYIDGVAYGKIKINKPNNLDTQLKKGGTAKVSITSTKTGNNTPYTVRILSEQVLDTFKVLAPENLTIRNNPWGAASEYALNYEARDTEGNEITDFRALYKAVQFSDNSVKLTEKDDGTASLSYIVNFGAISSTDGFDALGVFNVTTLTSGKSEQVRLNIKPDRYAASVAGLATKDGASEYIVEGNSVDVALVSDAKSLWVEFNDQYDEVLKAKSANLFRKGNIVGIKPIEADVIKVEIDDDGYIDTLDDGTVLYDVLTADHVTLTAEQEVTATKKNAIVEFGLYVTEVVDDETVYKLVGGSDKKISFYVVDINQCVEFNINRVPGYHSHLYEYGVDSGDFDVSAKLANGKKVVLANSTDNYTIQYTTNGNGVFVDQTGVSGSSLTVNTTLKTPEKATEIFTDYSKPTANHGEYARRNHKIDVTATVRGIDGSFKGSSSISMEVSNRPNTDSRYLGLHYDLGAVERNHKVWLYGDNKDTGLVKAVDGVITKTQLFAIFGGEYNGVKGYYRDTYEQITLTISKLVENKNGINPNGETEVLALGTGTNALVNAEIGDTFVATYSATGCASKTIAFTVGSDQNAWFTGSNFTADWR